jgi:aminobenzoyl-glutamate transport protein
LFVGLAGLVVVASAGLAAMGVSAVHPGTQEIVTVKSLLSGEMLLRMLTDAMKNFSEFPPLAAVLVTVIGIGVAERTGFIGTALTRMVQGIPTPFLAAALVFAGINSSLASDAGYVVLIPLGAALFAAAGRHPLAGLAATFAGVSAGFSANLLITSLDPLLSGITQKAAQLVEPTAVVYASVNYYFMLFSTFLLTIVGAAVSHWVVEPQLGKWKPPKDWVHDKVQAISKQESLALKVCGLLFVVILSLVLLGVFIPGSFFYGADGKLTGFYNSLVMMLMLLFLLLGLIYGWLTGKFKSDKDAWNMANESMSQLGGYIVLVFFIAQFLAYFSWSGMGTVTAIKGAEFLKSTGITGPVLLVFFIFFTSALNLIIGSASAKWALLAPIFVPMFMLVGWEPGTVQAAYRVGDSSTNIITPLLPYFALILVCAQRYVPQAGIGTVISIMLPYSISFFLVWSSVFFIWLILGLPFGF